MTEQQSKRKRRDREAKPRGVQLGTLDRSRVYRIGYVGRRWEVLGPESATEPRSAEAPASPPLVGPSAAAQRRSPSTPTGVPAPESGARHRGASAALAD